MSLFEILKAKPLQEIKTNISQKISGFNSEVCPIGEEIVMAMRALKSENKAEALENLLVSEVFLKLPEKNKMGIFFYIIVDIAYKKNKEAFLSTLEFNMFGSAGPHFLKLFLPDVNMESLLTDITLEERKDIVFGLWNSFLANNQDVRLVLEKCLDQYFELGRLWSNTKIKERIPMAPMGSVISILSKEEFIFREFLSGANTLYKMSSKVIKTLNMKSNEKNIMEHYKISKEELTAKKLEIANNTVRFFFRTLARNTPTSWQIRISNSKFQLFKTPSGELIVSSKDFDVLGSETFFKKALDYVSGKSVNDDLNQFHNASVISGCPFSMHPLFLKIPDILFKKIWPV